MGRGQPTYFPLEVKQVSQRGLILSYDQRKSTQTSPQRNDPHGRFTVFGI